MLLPLAKVSFEGILGVLKDESKVGFVHFYYLAIRSILSNLTASLLSSLHSEIARDCCSTSDGSADGSFALSKPDY